VAFCICFKILYSVGLVAVHWFFHPRKNDPNTSCEVSDVGTALWALFDHM